MPRPPEGTYTDDQEYEVCVRASDKISKVLEALGVHDYSMGVGFYSMTCAHVNLYLDSKISSDIVAANIKYKTSERACTYAKPKDIENHWQREHTPIEPVDEDDEEMYTYYECKYINKFSITVRLKAAG